MDLAKHQRIVIKIGSSLLISENQLNFSWLKTIAADIFELLEQGKDIIIVTSGAVALGRNAIGKNSGALRLEEKQAASSCGQNHLMQGYVQALAPRNVGQVLLTFWDTERRRNYLNAKSAIETIIDNGAIPVINENDVIATAELAYGDNDRLSARVAQMLDADLLILLSDVDGLYDKNPQLFKDAKHIDVVKKITAKIEGMAGDAGSLHGTGGMKTKIEAAKIAVNSGCDCVLSSGKAKHAIKKIFAGKQKFTIFQSLESSRNARKQWIVSGVKAMGKIKIDDGAARALSKGKSLLPAGVTGVTGKFERGDLVVVTNNGLEIARGLSAYSIANAKKIIGKKSEEIEAILGYSGRSELIHRDNMVVL
jgi:glutamate 5-kinase